MAKKGLCKEQIVAAAVDLVRLYGLDGFSLRGLAEGLGVRPPSLYNHIGGLYEIRREVVLYASALLKKELSAAVEGKPSDEAFLAGTRAYRRFADDNRQLYEAFVRASTLGDEEVRRAGFESFGPLRDVIKSYGLSADGTLHFIRALRSAMHGFIELAASGYMQRGPVSREKSYEVMLQGYLAVLKGGLKNEEIR